MENQIIDSVKKGTKYCEYCHSEGGKVRLVGQFIGKLGLMKVFGTKEQAFQKCVHRNEEEQLEDIGLFHLRRFGSMIRNVSFLIIIFSMPIMAQPGLPGDPAQAPIDGGLGLLAAAGGAYALRKLRDKKKAEEEEME